MKLAVALAACALFAASAANATTMIVDLNAGPISPNAGKNSGTYIYNPVVISLTAGTYTVGVVGKAGGGKYDAYTVYADSGSNAAWTDSAWSVSLDGGATAAYTQASLGRYNTSATALSVYSAATPYTFTLTGTKSVSFYVDDSAMPYFADDSFGVSLAVNSVATAVPEPASLLLLGVGASAAAIAVRRRRRA